MTDMKMMAKREKILVETHTQAREHKSKVLDTVFFIICIRKKALKILKCELIFTNMNLSNTYIFIYGCTKIKFSFVLFH